MLREQPEQLGQQRALLPLDLLYLDLLGLQVYGLSFARQTMRGNAGNFPG